MFLLNAEEVSAATRDVLIEQLGTLPIWGTALTLNMYGNEKVDEKKIKDAFKKLFWIAKKKMS